LAARNKKMKTRNRRGVLLLIVLALLAMFGVLAIAFVILTGHARHDADALRKTGQYDDQWEKILNQGALEAFRGSNNHQSPLQAHNFLENLYGNEWFTGNMTTASPVIGLAPQGQLIQFTFTATFPNKPFLSEQHLGAVLTMLAGPATGYSTHIVGMVGANQLQIAAFEGINSSDVISYINGLPAGSTCPCLINGMPYSGTGFGYQWPPAASPSASTLCYNNAVDGSGWEFALLPNHAAFPYTNTNGDPSYNASSKYVNWLGQPDPAGPGGANPDYTAPDYQNMFLALRLTTPTGNAYGLTPIPSFHRPELVNFWINRTGSLWNDPSKGPILQRKVLLRPLSVVGGTVINPGILNIDLVNGPWDVDNDGDGYPDSIWIDPGYEIRQTPDGRLYKPLLAYLIVDLDGRLNLNAHGSLAQLQADFGQTPNIGSTLFYGGAMAPPAGSLPRGHMGWGPADINLSPLFVNKPIEYQQLLAGMSSGGVLVDGRYGESNLSVAAPPYNLPSPGYSVNNANGNADDILSANKEFDYPSNYLYALGYNASTAADPTGRSAWQAYGTPPDLQGGMATALDFRGQPIYGVLSGGVAIDPVNNNPGSMLSGCYSALCGNWTYETRTNNPYELDLSLRQPRGLRSPAPLDNPFSAAEFERIMRPYDRDAGTLPGRLLALSPMCLGNASAGMGAKVTTDSWDLPCPNLAVPVNTSTPPGGPPVSLRTNSPTGDGRIRHITDLLKAAGVTTANMATLLPPDILSGLRMDINRYFGNGIDDSPNGIDPNGTAIVDEPAEADSGVEQMPYVAPPGVTAPTAPLPRMDYANSGSSSTLVDPRQMCFRYLFVLGMILTDPQSAPPNWFQFTLPGTPPNLAAMSTQTGQADVRARWIAQWAANVVSFRDRDSIMKPFAYDPQFLANSGQWNPSSYPAGKYLVFGCERPELLISETLAFHEKRTEVFPDNETPPKQLLMQRMRPQGSLYIELFNPWSATEAPPAEFYYSHMTANGTWQQSGTWQQGVVLNQTNPQGQPVWRLIIPADTSVSKLPITTDPDDPNITLNIERSIYFANPSNGPAIGNDGTEFYPSAGANGPQPVLLHNHYALVGPPSSDSNGTWISKSASGAANTALILLSPSKYSASATAANWPVQVLNNSAAGQNDLPVSSPLSIKVPLPIVMDQVTNAGVNPPPRLSISEPLGANAYPQPGGGVDPTTNDPQYFSAPPSPPSVPLQPPYAPLDSQPTAEQFGGVPVGGASGTNCGVLPACRVVHLQRLANPLLKYDPNPADIAYTTDGEIDWTKSTYNPYRTIDSMPIDLTVYNGWETPANLAKATPVATEAPMTTSFHSRQRGDYAFWTPGGASTTGTYLNNLWAQEWQTPTGAYPNAVAPAPQLSNQMFQYQLQHTLAYLNHGYGAPCAASQEYLGDPAAASTTSTPPFPWLTWNNRPFCSPMELMLVPALSSSQLLYNFNVIGNPFPYSNPIPNNPAPVNPAPVEPGNPAPATSPYTFANQPFGQLLNFFNSQPQQSPTNQLPVPAQFYRILEYLRVPSRFVGTELQVNPAFCGDGTGVHQFHPPYNRISRYRDPGRINLNTLNDMDVWNGLMQSAPGLANNPQAFANFLFSRKGYGSVNSSANLVGTVAELNNASPTRFANAFRSFEGSHLVPLDVLNKAVAGPQSMDVNATLLRQDPSNPNRPLFGFDATIAGSVGSTRQYNNDQRNPYFRYQDLQRLGNLTTTRSNVFAVWITVGYFQVQKAPALAGGLAACQQFIYPDGYQIIGELGADTNEVKRHRAFFIFDRSIPMGYQRGHDNNVTNGILLSRMIE
jgi:hypothetical protein